MKRIWGAVAVAAALVVSGAAAWSISSPPEYVPERFRTRLQTWLLLHPTYRWARDADCGCDEDLFNQRTGALDGWKADPDYRPYLAYGDLDGDTFEDVAVGVKSAGGPSTYRVLILSGRSGVEPYLSGPFGFKGVMFVGSEPRRLIVTAFETEGGSFEPAPGGGYRFVTEDCC